MKILEKPAPPTREELALRLAEVEGQLDRAILDRDYFSREAQDRREVEGRVSRLLDQAREQLRRIMPAIQPVNVHAYQETVELIGVIDRELYGGAAAGPNEAPEPQPECEECGDAGFVADPEDGSASPCPACSGEGER